MKEILVVSFTQAPLKEDGGFINQEVYNNFSER